MSLSKLHQLFDRPDVRRNPFIAIGKRIWWRIRWLLTAAPWELKTSSDIRIFTPRGGVGALIYYQGTSEPETREFLLRFLRRGMVFVDVGANIGEYTTLAAKIVGDNGQIHAFEAQPATFKILCENIKTNAITNVTLNQCAVSHIDGTVLFETGHDPAESAISTGAALRPVTRVQSVTLSSYCKLNAIRPQVIKIDVEGAELSVLEGAVDLFSKPADAAPLCLFEYAPRNLARFGVAASDLLKWFVARGYSFSRWDGADWRETSLPITAPGTINLLARKIPECV